MPNISLINTKSPYSYTKKWFLLGIPMLFLLSGVFHFIYAWTGNFPFIGILFPVNESVWEHLKLSFYPIILWFSLCYAINKNYISSIENWVISCTTAEIACILVTLCFFYTYTGALGIQSLIVDIFSLLLALTIAFNLAFHIHKHGHFTRLWFCSSILILVLLILFFTIFTFVPPHIPLFKDMPTGSYGI